MYRPIIMYQIVCDRCEEVFGGTDTCSALFSNKEVAKLIPVIQAFLEGKTIERKTRSWELNKG